MKSLIDILLIYPHLLDNKTIQTLLPMDNTTDEKTQKLCQNLREYFHKLHTELNENNLLVKLMELESNMHILNHALISMEENEKCCDSFRHLQNVVASNQNIINDLLLIIQDKKLIAD